MTQRLSTKRLGGRLGVLVLAAFIAVPALAAVFSKKHYFEVREEPLSSLNARFDLALGTVEVGKAEPGYLFQAEVTLETEQLRPDFNYESRNGEGTLTVDLESKKDGGRGFPSLSAAKKSRWLMLFGDQVPLDLNIEMGAARGEFDFSDLPIRNLNLDTGASSSMIAFHEPNPIEMENLVISAGASQLTVEGIANARARTIEFEGGVGSYELDFSDGLLIENGRADISIGVASLTIVLPRHGPIILTAPDNWLSNVTVPDSFTKQGDGLWFSEEVRNADQAFRVAVDAGMSKITFVHP